MKSIRQIIWAALLVILDIAVLAVVFKTVWYVRANIFPYYFPEIFQDRRPLIFVQDYYWVLVYWPILFFYEELYGRPLTFWEETKRLLKANTIATLLVVLFIGLTRAWLISRSIVILMWLLGIFIFPSARYFFKRMLFRMGLFNRTIVLYGAGMTGKAVLVGLGKHPELGLDVMGFIDDDPAALHRHVGVYRDRKVDVIGVAGDFLAGPEAKSVDEIVITISDITRERLIGIMERCSEVVDRVDFVPDIFGAAIYTASFECIDTALVMKFDQNLSKLFPRTVKRAFDIVASSVLILLLTPVWLAVFVAIKLDTGGAVLYRQKRIARGGGVFEIWKYRSMVENSGPILDAFLGANPEARAEWDEFRKLKGFDPRVTAVGRFIRKWSIDELPQLLNVFMGQMSLVGPRPYLPEEAADMSDYKNIIVKAKPGITGFWQVSGRNNLSFTDRLRLDVFYVKNWSFWLDITMLFKTIPVIINKDGAF
jgi:undecaprenyl-phosphate galactose phosphotransferase